MSGPDQTNEPLGDEDLLAAAMGEQRSDDFAARCTPAQEQQLREWEAFLVQCRKTQTLQEATSHRHATPGNAHLVQSILSQTTREDLSFRGDLRLISAFVRRRCEESPVVRVAAAVLLIQLLFAPAVMAYLALMPRDPDPEFYVRIDQPIEAGVREAIEEPLTEFLPERPWDLTLDELSRDLRREEVLALSAGLPEALVLAPGETDPSGFLPDQLILHRIRRQSGEEDLLPFAQSAWEDPLVRALSIEAALDVLSRGSLGVNPEEQLGALLLSLPQDGAPEDLLLLGASLARADAHGQLTGYGHELLSQLRRVAIRHPLLEAGPRRGGPLGAVWKSALQDSLAARQISAGLAYRLSLSN